VRAEIEVAGAGEEGAGVTWASAADVIDAVRPAIRMRALGSALTM
jgi:hypothetical protein